MRQDISPLLAAAKREDWDSLWNQLAEMTEADLHAGDTQTLLLLMVRSLQPTDEVRGQTGAPSNWMACFAELLRMDADLNAGDQALYQYPLHEAVARGLYDLAAILLTNGADPNRLLEFNGRDNEYAVSDGTALHIAAESGLCQLVALLIDHGAQIQATGHAGQTPLHAAARAGRVAAVELLLARGANPSSQIQRSLANVYVRGETPLHVAVAFLQSAVVEVLVAHGASLSIRDERGFTARDILTSGSQRVTRVFGRSFPTEWIEETMAKLDKARPAQRDADDCSEG